VAIAVQLSKSFGTHGNPDGCRVTLLYDDVGITAPQWVDIRSWEEALAGKGEAPIPKYSIKPESTLAAPEAALDVNTTNRYRLVPYTVLSFSCESHGSIAVGGWGGGERVGEDKLTW
jgi:hypothetical protein